MDVPTYGQQTSVSRINCPPFPFQPSVNKFDHGRERGPKDYGEDDEEGESPPKTTADINLHVVAVATLFALSTSCFLDLVASTGCAAASI